MRQESVSFVTEVSTIRCRLYTYWLDNVLYCYEKLKSMEHNFVDRILSYQATEHRTRISLPINQARIAKHGEEAAVQSVLGQQSGEAGHA